MSNHSPSYDAEMQRKMMIAWNEAKEHEIGPTGRFPHGQLTPNDQGESIVAVGIVDGQVVVNFGPPIAWIGFTPELARALAESLLKHADAIDGK